MVTWFSGVVANKQIGLEHEAVAELDEPARAAKQLKAPADRGEDLLGVIALAAHQGNVGTHADSVRMRDLVSKQSRVGAFEPV